LTLSRQYFHKHDIADELSNSRNHLALLVNITLNCQMVGFAIGCHEAIITVSWNIFTVVQIEFVIKML